ncbi:MAG: MFS transporter [Thermodesulfobacteriota bacterium]
MSGIGIGFNGADAGGRPAGGLYYGWYIVAVAFLGNFMSTGTSFYIFNAFMLPLCEARGWTRAQINIAPMLGYFFGLAAQFYYGTVFHRWGPRWLMPLGAVVSCACFFQMGRVREIGLFYFFYILLYLGHGAMGGLVANVMVSNWFVRNRGRALGLATTGISLSGVVLPYLALVLLRHTSLEMAFTWIAVLILLVGPVAGLVARTSPESCGLLPDGLPRPAGLDPESRMPVRALDLWDGPEWTLRQTAGCSAVWRLGLAYALAMMVGAGVMYQLAPRFQDQGFDQATAMTLTVLVAGLAAGGKYLWGWLCDRTEPRRVVAVLMLAQAVGLGLGLWPGGTPALVLFMLVFGVAAGGMMATYPILAADLFGRSQFPQVYRFLILFLGLQGFGYLMMGQSFSLTGSYDLAYGGFIVLSLLAAGLIAGLKRPAG